MCACWGNKQKSPGPLPRFDRTCSSVPTQTLHPPLSLPPVLWGLSPSLRSWGPPSLPWPISGTSGPPRRHSSAPWGVCSQWVLCTRLLHSERAHCSYLPLCPSRLLPVSTRGFRLLLQPRVVPHQMEASPVLTVSPAVPHPLLPAACFCAGLWALGIAQAVAASLCPL